MDWKHDWYDFNFNIPDGVVIKGIQVDVEGNGNGYNTGSDIELSWDGGITYTETSKGHIWTGSGDYYFSFGIYGLINI